MLEKMDAFFEARLEGYDAHMRNDIEGAEEFYPFTAEWLPAGHILDLGCGTGLELEYYVNLNPEARITGIDLSAGMLAALREKFPGQDLTLIQGSYFDVPFGRGCFDGAVSVESLHHFPQEEKIPLYSKLHAALKDGGYFILTDYFAPDEAYEAFYFEELHRLKKEQGIADKEFYHYDTPLTVAHEREALIKAGFSQVEVLKNWGATYTLKAQK
jgi:tRNA (cmo5U34)-methyltransferase